jgi:hypothetical protein
MSDAAIAEHADVVLGFDRDGNLVDIIEMSNVTQLRQFLDGHFPDDAHFRLTNNITLTTSTAVTAGQTVTGSCTWWWYTRRINEPNTWSK